MSPVCNALEAGRKGRREAGDADIDMSARKQKGQRKPAKPRDPYWRLRRALGAKRKASARVYRRAQQRAKEREAEHGDEQ